MKRTTRYIHGWEQVSSPDRETGELVERLVRPPRRRLATARGLGLAAVVGLGLWTVLMYLFVAVLRLLN